MESNNWVSAFLLAGVLLVGTSVPVEAEHERTEVALFVGTSTTGGSNAVTGCTSPVNVADACFVVLPGETSADVLVADLSGEPVAAIARLYDAEFGRLGSSGTFCGFMDNLALVEEAAFMVVQILDPVNASIACDGPGEDTAPGVAGTVTAGFH